MAQESTTPGSSEKAKKAFAVYRTRVSEGDDVDFEVFCRQHGSISGELQRLHDEWKQVVSEQTVVAAPVTERIRLIVGEDVHTNVALDKPDEGPNYTQEIVDRLDDSKNRIGRYRFRGEVARGGQGVILRVFDQDLRRHLAMKVVLGEGDDKVGSTAASNVPPKTLGRFLEEAQVTGQLDHPGIVPVHELGLDTEGRVYFTMKFVKGEDLGGIFGKTVAGEEGWSRPRVLNVLVKVCEAMSYAHHKGVIHRDLKPANVMVGRFGEVYVMDWGLARVLDMDDAKDVRIKPATMMSSEVSSDRKKHAEEAADAPLMTMDGDVVGTPAYMPPEQAVGDVAAMGPHSDVYSLGALLYELLAGHPPYARPGTRLNNIAIWYQVQNDPPHPLAKEAPEVPPELVAICEKAMDRDISKRYPDMSGLAEDLRAFIEGRVVQAYETGAVAELRKWVARNKPLAYAMAGGVLALIAGFATTWVQKGRADRNAVLAFEREELAVNAEAKATAEAERANNEAETARQTADFLVGLFEVVDPGEARGNTITAREILDKGAERIDTELGDQPEIQSALMETMGSVYKSLGLYDKAIPLLERSLARREETFGSNHMLVSETLNDLGEVRRLKADYEEAEPILRRALEVRRAELGEEHVAVAESMYELGVVLKEMGRYDEAEPLLRGSLELRRKLLGRHQDVAKSLNMLAFNLYYSGDTEAPEPLLLESLDIRRELLGEHPATAEGLNDLGVLLFEARQFERAEALLEEALEMKRRIYTDVHPEVALSLNNLAVSYHERRAHDAAEELYLEALEIQRQIRSGAHPDTAQAIHNVAVLRKDKSDWEGAKELFIASLVMYHEVHGDGHPSVDKPLANTIKLLRELADQRRSEYGERSPEYAFELRDLAGLFVLQKSYDEAIDTAFQATEILAEALSAEHWQTARAESVVGAALAGLGQYGEAEELLLNSYETLERSRGLRSPETQETIVRLVDLYVAWNRPEADEYRSQLIGESADR